MIKAIFWDNDGVLVDTEHLYFRATQHTLASVGVNLTEEMYTELFLVQAKGAWHLVAEKGISLPDMDRLRSERNALYLELLETEAKVIDGVEDVLRTLQGNYVMGIVTSSHRKHFEAIHRKTGLKKYFSFTLTAEDYDKYKPDPEPYLLALQKAGCSADECLAIEDSRRGLVSARGAGVKCVIIPNHLTKSASFDGAHAIIHSVREVPPIIDSLSGSQSRESTPKP